MVSGGSFFQAHRLRPVGPNCPMPSHQVWESPGPGSIIGSVEIHSAPEPASMSDVTRILWAIEEGHVEAAEQLLPLVYD